MKHIMFSVAFSVLNHKILSIHFLCFQLFVSLLEKKNGFEKNKEKRYLIIHGLCSIFFFLSEQKKIETKGKPVVISTIHGRQNIFLFCL